MDNLELLKEIAERMPDGNLGTYDGEFMEMETDGGIGYQIGLLKNSQVAVAKGIFSRGTRLRPHFHKELETILVYEGKLKIWCDVENFDECLLKEGKETQTGIPFMIDRNIPHVVEAVEDTKLIVITIPASKRFPYAHKK